MIPLGQCIPIRWVQERNSVMSILHHHNQLFNFLHLHHNTLASTNAGSGARSLHVVSWYTITQPARMKQVLLKKFFKKLDAGFVGSKRKAKRLIVVTEISN
jgi:hypothetical protein